MLMGLKQKVLIQHYLRLGSLKGPLLVPNIKGPKQVCFIYPSYIYKGWGGAELH